MGKDIRELEAFTHDMYKVYYQDALEIKRFLIKSSLIFSSAALAGLLAFAANIVSGDKSTISLLSLILPVACFSIALHKGVKSFAKTRYITNQFVALSGRLKSTELNSVEDLHDLLNKMTTEMSPGFENAQKKFEKRFARILTFIGLGIAFSLTSVFLIRMN